MTTATITDLELLRTRVSGAVGRQMPEHIGRLGWDAGRLAACQRDRLRALLARAIAGSPFHADGSAASIRTGSSSPTWPGCR